MKVLLYVPIGQFERHVLVLAVIFLYGKFDEVLQLKQYDDELQVKHILLQLIHTYAPLLLYVPEGQLVKQLLLVDK